MTFKQNDRVIGPYGTATVRASEDDRCLIAYDTLYGLAHDRTPIDSVTEWVDENQLRQLAQHK